MGGYSHDALVDAAAASIAGGGPIAIQGMGKPAQQARAAAATLRATMLREQKMTGADLPTVAAAYKANGAALTQNNKLLSATRTFEQTIKGNAEQALALLDKGGGPSGPILKPLDTGGAEGDGRSRRCRL